LADTRADELLPISSGDKDSQKPTAKM